MGTISDKLQYLLNAKELIKDAIIGKGQTVSSSDTLKSYATKIGNISSECTATSASILGGKTAYSGGSKITGTIASKGAQTYTPSTTAQTITAGQYLSGTQTISAVTGTAVVANVLSGKTFNSASGINLTGTMTNRGTVASAITTQGGSYTIPSGYHSGSGKVTASFANLTAGNIKSGVNVGGVVGNLSEVQSRTIRISYSTSYNLREFYLFCGNSRLVNLKEVSYSSVPSTINTYGDMLILYTHGRYGEWHRLYPTSGATELFWYDTIRSAGKGWTQLTQVFKLTSTTPTFLLDKYND